MTEKDKELLEQALTSAWGVRDKLKLMQQMGWDNDLRTIDACVRVLSNTTLPALVRLQSDVFSTLLKLQNAVNELAEKVEMMGVDQSNLEDEVAALEEQVNRGES
jgi:predicted nuclease with TOPRIM domain